MEPNQDQQRYQELARKWLDKSITPEEEQEFAEWYNAGQHQPLNIPQSFVNDEETHRERILAKIREAANLPGKHKIIIWRWPRIAAAASILLCLSIGGYFLFHKKPAAQIAQNQIHDIAPGGNKATLTLSNGQKIILSDAHNGTIASQGQTLIKKTEAGKVVYESSPTANNGDERAAFNTVTTPRGGQWPEVALPDGSKVMLDAASSIKYPVRFSGKERVVEITGEAYFEVSHDKAHPFRVTVKGQTIEDLGTRFNINAYDDEPAIRVTLEQGSVRVIRGQQSVLLVPGQQAITNTGTDFIRTKEVDVDETIAWKNGQTSFKDLDIQAIMRQVSRWYDVDAEFRGNIPARSFTGGISRKSNLSSLLKVLELNNIHFDIEGKKIIVKP
jgi:transmembrane sensor